MLDAEKRVLVPRPLGIVAVKFKAPTEPIGAIAPPLIPLYNAELLNIDAGTKLRSSTPEAILLMSIPSHKTRLCSDDAPPKEDVTTLPGEYCFKIKRLSLVK